MKPDDLEHVEANIEKLELTLFQIPFSRVIRVLAHNYLQAFYQNESLKLTRVHACGYSRLGFNGNGESLPERDGKQSNIFAHLQSNKAR